MQFWEDLLHVEHKGSHRSHWLFDKFSKVPFMHQGTQLPFNKNSNPTLPHFEHQFQFVVSHSTHYSLQLTQTWFWITLPELHSLTHVFSCNRFWDSVGMHEVHIEGKPVKHVWHGKLHEF